MNLSLRLKTIAALVPYGSRVCDVGTDHGYLPVFLLKSDIAKSVIATDIREKPLENARKNIQFSGISGIDLRLCDGLSAVTPTETDTVIIAGMGGEVISGIIGRTPWLKNGSYSLILQPTTSPEFLRRFLTDNGFEILSETPLSENRKLYSVMSVSFSGNHLEQDEYFYYIGKITPKTNDGCLYIKKQYSRLKTTANALKNIPEKKQKFEYYDTVSKQIGKVLNITEK